MATWSAGIIMQVQNGGSDTHCGGGGRFGARVATPAAPTAAAAAGGAVTAGDYFVVVTVVDRNGETGKSPETKVTTAGGNLTIAVTAPTLGAQTYYNIYVGTTTQGPYYQQSVGNTAGVNITTTPPTALPEAPGTDRSKTNSAFLTIDNITVTATTPGANSNVLTFTGPTIGSADDIGNLIKVTAGTNINADTYEVVDFTSSSWTLSGTQNLTTAGGAGSAIVGYMGGALATPGQAATISANGKAGANGLFINYSATPYSCSATSNGSGGKIDSNIAVFLRFIAGYDTTRDIWNTDANRPTLQATANSMTICKVNDNTTVTVSNLIFSANGHTTVTGFNFNSNGGSGCKAWRLEADNLDGSGFTFGADKLTMLLCVAGTCGTGFNQTANHAFLHACVASACTTAALAGGSTMTAVDCVSTGCAAGFTSAAHLWCAYCTDYNTTASSGFVVNNSGPTGVFINCISDTNTASGPAYGYFCRGNFDGVFNSASRANKTADTAPPNSAATIVPVVGLINPSGIPFTNAGGNDLSLNNTGGAGAVCRAAGLPNTGVTALPGLSTSSYPDVGAVQHQDGASTTTYVPSQMVTQIIVDP